MDLARKAIVPGLIILVVAGIGAGMYFTAQNAGECPGHWHATFHVYVDDDRISYGAYNLENQRTPLSHHLHSGDDAKVHFEPPTGGCIGFSEFLSKVDTRVTSDSLRLDGIHEDMRQGGTFTSDGNRTLHIFHAPDGDNWKSISASALNKRQLLDGERVLIAFGEYSEAQIEMMQNAVPYPNGRGGIPPTHPGA